MRFKPGDWIRCASFARGEHPTEWSDGLLEVDTRVVTVKQSPNVIHWSEKQTREGGWERRVDRVTDPRSFDDSRGEAVYVITSAHVGGGGTGHGPHDVFPDGEQYEARRLDDGGNVVPLAPIVCFTIGGCFTSTVTDVTLVEDSK